MNDNDYKKVLLKNLWWLSLIIIAAIWFRIDLNFNSAFPLENAAMLKAKLISNSEGSNIIHDNYSLPFFSFIFGFGGLIFSRITSLILSLFMLFFLYKFVNRTFNDKLASVISVLFFAIGAPVIFLGKFATLDILSLTFFSAFLMVGSEIFTINDRNKKVPFINIPKQYFCPIAASALFVLSAFSNYVVFLYLIPTFIIFLIKDKKSALYFLIPTLIFSILIYLINNVIINHQISTIINLENDAIKITKLMVRIAEYLAIPVMLTFALQQMLWKTSLKNSLIFTTIALSLLIPIYIVLSNDVFNIYRLIPFSLILLAPFCGLLISKFIVINPSYKYAAVFAMYFILLVTYWQLSKLEVAYPETDTIVNYCKEYIDKNDIIYSEDPFLISNNLYPKLDIKNFRNIYYYDSKNKTLDERKKAIINQIENGFIDYVILNGLFHTEFTEELKERYMKNKFIKMMIQEFTINTFMYPIKEGNYEIFKIKEFYRNRENYLAKEIGKY